MKQLHFECGLKLPVKVQRFQVFIGFGHRYLTEHCFIYALHTIICFSLDIFFEGAFSYDIVSSRKYLSFSYLWALKTLLEPFASLDPNFNLSLKSVSLESTLNYNCS